MKLCEHIAPIYRNEIKQGNRPLYVSTPKSVDKFAIAEIYIIMKNKLQKYDLDNIQENIYKDYRFPQECYYGCPICKHYISGPLYEKQESWFENTGNNIPNSKVKATNENIYLEDGVCGKGIVPILDIKK